MSGRTWSKCRADELRVGDVLDCDASGMREVRSVKVAERADIAGLREVWLPPNLTRWFEPDALVDVYR